MARTAFVHIGTHKTGTTYLQSLLRANQSTLRRNGLDYPLIGTLWDEAILQHLPVGSPPFQLAERIGCNWSLLHTLGLHNRGWRNSAHKLLAFDSRKKPPLDYGGQGYWGRLGKHIEKNEKNILISAETFSDKGTKKETCDNIVKYFNRYQYKTIFIIFLRDIPAYIASRYAQDTKNLRVKDSIINYTENNIKRGKFKYRKILKTFDQSANLIVLPYAPGKQVIEEVFFKAIGQPLSILKSENWQNIRRLNERFGLDALELARQLTAQLPENLSREDRKRKARVFKELCIRHGLNDRRFIGFAPDYAQELRHRFSEQTDWVAQKYWDRPWSEAVPPEQSFEQFDPSIEPGEAFVEHSQAILAKIHAIRPATQPLAD